MGEESTKTPAAAAAVEWNAEEIAQALAEVVAAPWKVALSYRRGAKPGAERAEDVVGVSARVDRTIAVSWSSWGTERKAEGYRLRAVCSLGAAGVASVAIDVEEPDAPTGETLPALLRELVRMVKLNPGGAAAWKRWRKESGR